MESRRCRILLHSRICFECVVHFFQSECLKTEERTESRKGTRAAAKTPHTTECMLQKLCPCLQKAWIMDYWKGLMYFLWEWWWFSIVMCGLLEGLEWIGSTVGLIVPVEFVLCLFLLYSPLKSILKKGIANAEWAIFVSVRAFRLFVITVHLILSHNFLHNHWDCKPQWQTPTVSFFPPKSFPHPN